MKYRVTLRARLNVVHEPIEVEASNWQEAVRKAHSRSSCVKFEPEPWPEWHEFLDDSDVEEATT